MSFISFSELKDCFDRPFTYTSQEKSYKDSLDFIKTLEKLNAYKFLIKFIDKEEVNIFLYKLIYDSILPINNILLLDKTRKTKKIDVIFNSERYMLNDQLINHLYPQFHSNYNIIRKNFYKKKIKKFLEKNFTSKIPIRKNIYNISKKNIAIKITQQYNQHINDVSWVKYSKINKKNIIYYFLNLEEFKFLGGNQYLKYFKENNFNYVVMDSNLNQKVLFFDNILLDLKKIKSSNFIEIWLLKVFHDLVEKIKYWHIFFKKYNIVMHEDPTPGEINNIIKYIALKKNNGKVFSIQRSYPMNYDGVFASYYNNDYFFCWGKHSKRLYENILNINKELIETGVSFSLLSNNPVRDDISKFFKKRNIRYKILLLDTNHSFNDQSIYQNHVLNYQTVHTNSLEIFYMKFFDLISKNHKIGLVIKPKKMHLFNKLKNVKKFIKEGNKNNIPIYLIEDKDKIQLNDLKTEIDLVVNVSFYTPSIFMESIILGFRTICYDYANIFNFEKNQLNIDDEILKNISNNMDEIIKLISRLFSDIANNKSNDYGYWSKKSRMELDRFLDGNGNQRIANKLDEIFNNLKNN